MGFHKIWQEQCEANRTIRERFGVKNALHYLIGEKLLNFDVFSLKENCRALQTVVADERESTASLG